MIKVIYKHTLKHPSRKKMKIKKRGKKRKMGLKSDKIGNGVPTFVG